jgi:nitrite reductase (NADH) small subunit/3-phenylpropionate/trans-cinnamate dioxygenase ferredoxin subunit
MPKLVTVAKTSDLPVGSCLSVEAEGMGLALCNVNGTVSALDNTCPHAGGPLGEGTIEGDCVVCPWHGWRYHVATGERPENPDFKVECFPVVIEGDVIKVTLP